MTLVNSGPATRAMPIQSQPQAPPPPPPPSRPEPRGFRPDIEGLRALAVLLVVLYHAKLANVTGGYVGVDVFFVLSGFLITRQLVANVDKRGWRELPAFYARRVRRLLPASTAVVAVTIIASHIWAPALQAKNVTTDALFTLFYGLNYRLAAQGTDYMHVSDAVSPLQHFWSLGVEEQFYFAWPLIVVLVMLLPRRVRRWALLVVILGVGVVSLRQSATITATEPAWAYFSITTRAWELAAGGLVALTAAWWALLPRWPANLLAWAGVAAVLASGWMLNDATPYPGVWAAWPVGATALVVGCGCAARHHGIERLLAEPVLQGIGKVSYSWYLWHWPILIIAPYIAHHPISWPRRIEIVLLTLSISVLSYHIIENPVRRLRKANGRWFRVGIYLGGVVASIAVISANTIVDTGQGIVAHAVILDIAKPGLDGRMSTLLTNAVGISKAPRNLTPKPTLGGEDVANSWHEGCLAEFKAVGQGDCVYGDPHGRKTVVLMGDSHAEQYSAGLQIAAKAAGWKLVIWAKSACPPATLTVYAPFLKRTYTECDTWRSRTIARIRALKPQLVLISQSDNVPGDALPPAQWAGATVKTVQQFTTARIPVTFLLDTPFPGVDVPTCVADHLQAVRTCVFARAKAYTYPARRAAVAKAVQSTGARVVDPASWLCGPTLCPAIVSNILVWRDSGHMTATYSAWLAPVFGTLLPSTTPKVVHTPRPSA